MKVWIARDKGADTAHAYLEKPEWSEVFGQWDIDYRTCSGYICMKVLRKLGVTLKPGECKQYDIPQFREVAPRAKRTRR